MIILLQVDGLQKLLDGLSSHSYTERASPSLSCLLIFLLGQYLLILQVRLPSVQNDIRRKIQHLLQRSRRQIQNQSHTAGNSFKIPDMRYRRGKGNMSHTLAAHA